jgi:hypothetical protein
VESRDKISPTFRVPLLAPVRIVHGVVVSGSHDANHVLVRGEDISLG